MSSRLNELENEGLIVLGRPVGSEWDSVETIRRVAAAVDAWGKKLSLPLGLVYCGTTVNWPDEFEYTPVLIGLITFSGFGDDDEPIAGEVGPEAMNLAGGEKIPDAFWHDLEEAHGLELEGETDVYLATAGWTWARLEADDGESVCGVSTEDDGYTVVPEDSRSGHYVMKVGYC